MANIFIQDPVYTTIQDVKDSTSKPAIALLTDNELKELIYKSQVEIDAYIGMPKFAPFSDTQTRLFPITDQDGDSYIPNEISIACIYTVEQIYVNGDTITAGGSTGGIKKEVTGDYQIEYEGGSSSRAFGYTSGNLPQEATNILDKFKSVYFGSIV